MGSTILKQLENEAITTCTYKRIIYNNDEVLRTEISLEMAWNVNAQFMIVFFYIFTKLTENHTE